MIWRTYHIETTRPDSPGKIQAEHPLKAFHKIFTRGMYTRDEVISVSFEKDDGTLHEVYRKGVAK